MVNQGNNNLIYKKNTLIKRILPYIEVFAWLSEIALVYFLFLNLGLKVTLCILGLQLHVYFMFFLSKFYSED